MQGLCFVIFLMAAAWNCGDSTGARSRACVAMAAGGFVHTAFRALTIANVCTAKLALIQ